jgi:hypothetical protein
LTRAGSWVRDAGESLAAAALPFAVSRVIVIAAMEIARFLVSDHRARSRTAAAAAHAGLLGWDAHWYELIARVGYGRAGDQSLRFFPLLPLAARGLADVGLGVGTAVLIVSNVAALVAMALIHRLVLVETHNHPAARRAPWWLALFPASFVLVMGYAESLLLVAALVTFLCLRTERFAWAGLAGMFAGACRPVGLLLAVPAFIEALRGSRGFSRSAGEWAGRAAAVLGAPAGTAAYLIWSKAHDGSFLLPFREQVSSTNRGGIADPVVTIGHDLTDLLHRQHLGTALHAPWAVVLVILALVVWRHWPASYGAYATASLVVALTAPNLTSLERYGLGCFPFVLALTTLTERQGLKWVALSVSAALLGAYAVMTFLGVYVP